MKELYELQTGLNSKVFQKRGLGDWEGRVKNPGSPELLSGGDEVWIENFRKAFTAEYAEFLVEINSQEPDRKNIVIEIVDMMHFLISLSQLVDLSPERARDNFDLGFTKVAPIAVNDRISGSILLYLDMLQNSVKWKWWADGGGFKKDEATRAIIMLWMVIGALAKNYTDLDFHGLKEAFKAKCAVNHARQDNGYNEDTKTDADNQALDIPTK